MITEERLRDAMAACRDGVVPSPGFDDLGRRARRTERQRRVRAVLAAAAAVAVVGATVAVVERGEPTTTASARVKQEFVTSANQICDRAIQQIKADAPPGLPTLQQIDVAAQRASATDQTAIAALHALQPPPSDRATVEAMLTEFDKSLGASLVVIAVQDAVNGDTNAAAFDAALTTASKQIATAAQHASGYGVDRCAAMIYPIFERP